jgi:hypothetical protein
MKNQVGKKEAVLRRKAYMAQLDCREARPHGGNHLQNRYQRGACHNLRPILTLIAAPARFRIYRTNGQGLQCGNGRSILLGRAVARNENATKVNRISFFMKRCPFQPRNQR